MQETINAIGTGVVMLYGNDVASDNRIALLLPITAYSGNPTLSTHDTFQYSDDARAASSIQAIHWESNNVITTLIDGLWLDWDLLSGRVLPSKYEHLDNKTNSVRQHSVKLVQQINQPRIPKTPDDTDARCRSGFALENGNHFLLVGQMGKTRGDQDSHIKNSISIEWYPKDKIEFWPKSTFEVRPFGGASCHTVHGQTIPWRQLPIAGRSCAGIAWNGNVGSRVGTRGQQST
jgi:hypothetical protein